MLIKSDGISASFSCFKLLTFITDRYVHQKCTKLQGVGDPYQRE